MNGGRTPRTLRFRLGVTMGLLTVVVALVAPLLSVFLVRDHLEDRATAQLVDISDRVGAALSAVSPIQVPAQQVTALLPSLAVFVVVDSDGQAHSLGSAADALTPEQQTMFVTSTADLAPGQSERISAGSEHYAVARVATPGIVLVDNASTVEITDLIIGLGQRENDLLVNRLLWYTVAGACASMLVVGCVGAYLLRRGLRPLELMAGAATTAPGDDDMQAVVSHVARSNTDAEIIALATAFESAFAARQDAEARMRNFVADASHELRAPVTTMSSWIDHYLQGGLTSTDDIDRMVARLEAETGRMRLLLDEMTLLARSDAGVPFDLAGIDVAELVHEVVSDARVVTPDRTISFHSSGPARVLGDPHRLRQVFGNVVGNAQEHTPAGRPIEVRVSAGADVRVEVRDHGDGIPVDQLANLFDRFWRAEPGGARTQRHSGLGLAIVKAIVEAHGGTTTVTSESGVGTVVTVVLPAEPETVS